MIKAPKFAINALLKDSNISDEGLISTVAGAESFISLILKIQKQSFADVLQNRFRPATLLKN